MKKLSIGLSLGLAALTLSALAATIKSGPAVGENVNAFEPTHVTGPDKGTNTCPVCKYGMTSAVQVWVSGDDTSNVAKIAKTLEGRIDKAGTRNLKAFVIFVEKKGQSTEALTKNLTEIAAENNLKNVALAYVGPNNEAIGEYKINTDGSAKNTVLVYTNRTVTSKFVNLKADDQGISQLNAAVSKILN